LILITPSPPVPSLALWRTSFSLYSSVISLLFSCSCLSLFYNLSNRCVQLLGCRSVLSDEMERRVNKSVNLKMKKAGVMNLSSYDWNTTTKYDRDLVKKLMNVSFIEKRASILLFGPTGVGYGKLNIM
jgi:hypothetical protein